MCLIFFRLVPCSTDCVDICVPGLWVWGLIWFIVPDAPCLLPDGPYAPWCSLMLPDAPRWSMAKNRGHGLSRWVRGGRGVLGLETQPRSGRETTIHSVYSIQRARDHYTESANTVQHCQSHLASLPRYTTTTNLTVIMLQRVFTFHIVDTFLFSQQTNLSSLLPQFFLASPKLQWL